MELLLFKNIIEVFLVALFVPPDLYYSITEESNDGQECLLPIIPVEGYTEAEGEVAFICKPKKQRFMILMLFLMKICLKFFGEILTHLIQKVSFVIKGLSIAQVSFITKILKGSLQKNLKLR